MLTFTLSCQTDFGLVSIEVVELYILVISFVVVLLHFDS